MNTTDNIVQEVRKIRENLSAKHRHDLSKIIEDAYKRSATKNDQLTAPAVKANRALQVNKSK